MNCSIARRISLDAWPLQMQALMPVHINFVEVKFQKVRVLNWAIQFVRLAVHLITDRWLAMTSLKRVATEGLKFRRVDAQGQVVGRLASQIAQVLMGKDKPTYSPNKDDGDVVVVVNASKVEFTGNKWRDKLYRWHTGYPGGLKERSAQDQMARKPDDIIRRAVLGMLPKNKLRRAMNRKLIIAAGESHPLENHPQLENFTLPKRRIRPEPAIELSPGFKPFNPEAFSKRLQRRH